ncbi:hypothetical protein ONE63_009888 [Megalurothrips usitatus]|uniref:F-box domain-containing protein n=1 Tax=Megalurothrips usitatus TaxID=439358 RepID=A0AAV7XG28_9NEOP|nr:hypothetical protein ONE63_009888 [Megalurothrips usitatus]
MSTNDAAAESSSTRDNEPYFLLEIEEGSRLDSCLKKDVIVADGDNVPQEDLLENDPEIELEVEVEAGNSNELDPGPSLLSKIIRDCQQDNIEECDSNHPESSSIGPEDAANTGDIQADQVDSADGEVWTMHRAQDVVSSEADDEDDDDEEEGGVDSSSDDFDPEESVEARLRVYGDRASGSSPQETDLSPIASCSSQPSPPRHKRKLESQGDIQNRYPCKKINPDDKTAFHTSLLGNEEDGCPSSSKSHTLVPTKDSTPPDMKEWLQKFEHWRNADRLMAIDRLIESCEPIQVRHMLEVIEPQFQRDFISLLPKELALYVLSFLEPKDLLRAAQTCRNWRFLADDNLLWKEKCRTEGIKQLPDRTYQRRKNIGINISPWKAEYMRQHAIEMNWRTKPIRTPKELKGHDDHVITCLQFSGNRIVSGSDDNTLKVWSLTTGRCVRTLVGHTGGVWSSQMSGNTIISGSTDRTLKVWDADSGACIHTLCGHTSTVRCMHLHGKKVVSGSRDATLRVWDIEAGHCLHILVGHLAAVRCVQYDGRLVVSGAYDHMVKVWDPETEECLYTLEGHTNRVYSLQFDGVHVVSGSLDTSIRVWEVETGACRHTLMGHQSLTSGMELRNNILVSGNADSTVKVWDIVSGQCLQTLSGPNKHQSAVTCLQFNSRFVITSSDDGTVKLWDVKTGEFVRNLVALESGGAGGVVWRIRASETKLVCAVGSRNGTEETKVLVLDFDVDSSRS